MAAERASPMPSRVASCLAVTLLMSIGATAGADLASAGAAFDAGVAVAVATSFLACLSSSANVGAARMAARAVR